MKNPVKLLTPTSHSSTSPAMTGPNHTGSMDLSPNGLAHSALALHGLRTPNLTAVHGQNTSGGLDLNHGQSSPSLNYGNSLAHFMSSAPSRLPHLHNAAPLASVKTEKSTSSSFKSAAPSQSTPANGLAASPKDESSTPTPGQGIIRLTNTSLTFSLNTPSHLYI